MIGKGLDRDGAALFWVRCMGRPKSHHDLYRTVDGVAFEKIAEPSLEPFPMQITDIFHADGKLMALWFATRYREDDEQSWGTLVSADNGRTWTQRTVETVMKKSELPTEPCVVNLGGGRLLGLARTENGGGEPVPAHLLRQRRDVEEDAHEHPRHLRLFPLACLRRRNGPRVQLLLRARAARREAPRRTGG